MEIKTKYTKKTGEQLILKTCEKSNLAQITVVFQNDIPEDGIKAGEELFVCGGGVKDMTNCFNRTVAEDACS